MEKVTEPVFLKGSNEFHPLWLAGFTEPEINHADYAFGAGSGSPAACLRMTREQYYAALINIKLLSQNRPVNITVISEHEDEPLRVFNRPRTPAVITREYFSRWQKRMAEIRPVIVFKGQSCGITSAQPMNYVYQLPYNTLTNI